MSFPSGNPEAKALIGKYLEWFVDTEKNVLGWKVFKDGELSDLKNASQVTEYVYKGKSIIRASVALPLKGLDYTDGMSYKKLEVQKYKQQGMLNDGKSINYIEIEKPKRKTI